MSFEILRLMAQEYAERHKEPQPLPATIDTMAYAYQRICQGEDPWTALGDFSNAWYRYGKHIRPELIKDPLARPERETEQTPPLGGFLRLIRLQALCAEDALHQSASDVRSRFASKNITSPCYEPGLARWEPAFWEIYRMRSGIEATISRSECGPLGCAAAVMLAWPKPISSILCVQPL